jgi:hypothetical protein
LKVCFSARSRNGVEKRGREAIRVTRRACEIITQSVAQPNFCLN